MKLTNNEKQIITEVLEDVISNASKKAGGPTYNTDDDLLFSFSSEDYKALKRALAKIEAQ